MIEAVWDPSLIYCDDLAQIVLPAWRKGRVVLVDDAAYAMTPMLGAGGSKAMLGAYTLARELASNADYATAFARYERAMRPSIEHLQKQSRRMGQFATMGHPLVMFVRRTLFKYIPEALVVRMRSAPGTTRRSLEGPLPQRSIYIAGYTLAGLEVSA